MAAWWRSLVVLASCGGSSPPPQSANPTPAHPPASAPASQPALGPVRSALDKVQLRSIDPLPPLDGFEHHVSRRDVVAFVEDMRQIASRTLGANSKPTDVSVMVMTTPDAQMVAPFDAGVDPERAAAFRAALDGLGRLPVSGTVAFKVTFAVEPW